MRRTDPLTLLDFLDLAAGFLRERHVDNARLNAELLLCEVVGLKRIELYLQFDRPLDQREVEAYRELLRRRVRREPLQYILGATEFYGREFHLTPAVLIPRPETEVLVETALEHLNKDRSNTNAAAEPERNGATRACRLIADIGTGSGCIALTIAAECPDVRMIATDVSEDALAVARENADRMELADRIDFRLGDLLDPLAGHVVDAIVSNPPYVATTEREMLQPEVRDYEPEMALFAGDDGLSVLRRLIKAAPPHVRPGGFVALEIGLGQADRVRALWQEAAPAWSTRAVLDLAGVERIIVAMRPAAQH